MDEEMVMDEFAAEDLEELFNDAEDLLYIDEDELDEEEDEESTSKEEQKIKVTVGVQSDPISTSAIASGKADYVQTVKYPFIMFNFDTATEGTVKSYVQELLDTLLIKESSVGYMEMHMYIRSEGQVYEQGVTDNGRLSVLLKNRELLKGVTIYAKFDAETRYEGDDLMALIPLPFNLRD